jgi:hypothetical protein
MASNQDVVIINTAMARALQMDGQAAGNSVFYGSADRKIIYSVVGLVESGSAHRIYFPQYGQRFDGPFNFILRTSGKSPMIAQAAREAVFAADKSQTIADIGWVENMLAWRLREPRSIAALVSVFAFLGYALVLAGVYGTISHATNSRLREYGIRLAMGAQPFRLWIRASIANLPALLAGIAAGVGLSWYAIKIIRAKVSVIDLTGADLALMGMNPALLRMMDPALLDFRANLEMMALLSLALIVTAIAAGAFASRGILRIDPVTILRHE